MSLNHLEQEISNRLELIEDQRKKKVISSILKNNKWYIDLNLEVVINILMDLGFSKEQSINIYKYLITM